MFAFVRAAFPARRAVRESGRFDGFNSVLS